MHHFIGASDIQPTPAFPSESSGYRRFSLSDRDCGAVHSGWGMCELDAGGQTQRRQVMPSRSYLSQVELPVTFGLGSTDRIDALRIRWPDGSLQDLAPPAVDQLLLVEQP